MVKQFTTIGIIAALAMIHDPGVTFAQEAAPAEGINVLITGVVKDYDGKVVREGFVMLKNSPRLCTTTDGLGQFKIMGQAHVLPDTLLASWTGQCESAATAKGRRPRKTCKSAIMSSSNITWGTKRSIRANA